MEVLGTCSDAGCHPRARLRARSRFEGQARGRTASAALRTPSLVNHYYDPATGQFLTVDPLVDQTGQAYSYANDDPVNGEDPLGLYPGEGFVNRVGQTLASGYNTVNSAANSAVDWASGFVNTAYCQNFGGGGTDGRGLFGGWLDQQAGCGAGSDTTESGSNSAGSMISCTFAIGGVTSGPYNWGNLKTLLDHFGRHGPDFGSQAPEQYAQQASSFLEQMVRDGEIKVDPEDGAIRVYDPETNTFGSYNPDGTSKTLYKPDERQPYWDKQPGDEPWIGGE